MPKKVLFITDFVRIKNLEVYHQEKKIFSGEKTKDSFLKNVYRHLGIKYPKFHKMDSLCKLGILGTEVLFSDKKISPLTALVLSNRESSLESDLKHRASMDKHVSPAVFVYTLPNIVAGEISIKNGLYSENAFFVEEGFNAELLADYTEVLLNSGKAPAVVSGWIDVKNDLYDVFLCLISERGTIPHSAENLHKLYLFENE